MAQNPSISELDMAQIIGRVYDEANDSLRTELGSNSGVDIQLDSGSDSITSVPTNAAQKASLTSSSTGIVIAPFSVVGMTSVALYTNTTSAIVGEQVCTLQVSPSDTDDVWISTTTTVTPSETLSVVEMSSIGTMEARRAQVIIAAPITSGTFDLYANTSA